LISREHMLLIAILLSLSVLIMQYAARCRSSAASSGAVQSHVPPSEIMSSEEHLK